MKTGFHKKYSIFFVLIPIFTFIFGWTTGYQQRNPENNTEQEIVIEKKNQENAGFSLDLFWKIYNLLSEKYLYLDNLTYEKLLYGSIKGLVNSIEDPYSQFLTPLENEEFENALAGHLEGIGAELAKDSNDRIVIIAPLKGSPSEIAGIEPGDIILAIDDESAVSMGLVDVVKKIRGRSGTKVKLTIQRGDPAKVKDFEIKRSSISVPSVNLEWIENNIAIIQLTQFGDNTYKEFQKILSQVLLKSPKGIILDLRNNGGGLLDQAIGVVSEFVENKVVTKIETRISESSKETKEISEKTYGEGSAIGIPVVVWINRGSASASEIVAAFFKETGRGFVLGEKSFGKGKVQEVVKLINGSSLRVTTAVWKTPSGNSIDGIGVEPDELIANLQEMDSKSRDKTFKEKTMDYFKKLEE